MNSISTISNQLKKSLTYPYYHQVNFIIKTEYVLKVRIYINFESFIQIYRNDLFNSTNFILIKDNNRIYAKDQIRGKWHTHPFNNSDFHDYSYKGIKPITLKQFLKETHSILKKLSII